jgi:hypothetical protein
MFLQAKKLIEIILKKKLLKKKKVDQQRVLMKCLRIWTKRTKKKMAQARCLLTRSSSSVYTTEYGPKSR